MGIIQWWLWVGISIVAFSSCDASGGTGVRKSAVGNSEGLGGSDPPPHHGVGENQGDLVVTDEDVPYWSRPIASPTVTDETGSDYVAANRPLADDQFLSEFVARSSFIAISTIHTATSRLLDEQVVVTDNLIDIETLIKGDPVHLLITQGGMTADGVGMVAGDTPQVKLNQRSIVFAEHFNGENHLLFASALEGSLFKIGSFQYSLEDVSALVGGAQ